MGSDLQFSESHLVSRGDVDDWRVALSGDLAVEDPNCRILRSEREASNVDHVRRHHDQRNFWKRCVP